MAFPFPSSSPRWVLRKPRCADTDLLLEEWAGTKNLGAETFALTTGLLYAQAMVYSTRGVEIDNPYLDALLLKLRLLAYDADDVLDELELFRIQEELDSAADVHAGGCGGVHGLLLRASRAARSLAAKLRPSSGSRDSIRGGHHGQDKSSSQSQPWATKLQDEQKIDAKVMQKLASIGNEWQVQTVQPTKLKKFDRVAVSTKMRDILDKFEPLCAKVSTVIRQFRLEMLASRLA